MLILFSLIVIDGIISSGSIAVALFQNKIIKYFGSVSMEVYLCHMFVYRVIERLNLKNVLSNEILNYVLIAIVTIAGSVILAVALKKFAQLVENLLKKVECEKLSYENING